MQMPIFDSQSMKSSTAAVVSKSITQPPVPPIVTIYEQIWANFAETLKTHQVSLKDLAAMENQCDPHNVTRSAVSELHDHEIHFARRDLFVRIEDRLADYAARTFGANGVKIDIDLESLRKECRQRVYRELEDFSVTKFWNLLVGHYGNGRGEVIAYRQNADLLYDKFRIEDADAIVRKSGYVVLNLRVHCDDSRDPDGTGRYTHYSTESIKKTYDALSALCQWANQPHLANRLSEEAEQWFWHRRIKSQERMSFGPQHDIVVITFFNKIEFRLKPGLAESLQIFLAEYRNGGV